MRSKSIRRLFFVLLASSCLLMSCDDLRQEVVFDELVGEQTKLVVVGFISPQDSVLAVSVTQSAPAVATVSGGALSPVTNATVTLSDGAGAVVLRSYTTNPAGFGTFYYRADPRQFPIVAGRTYTLTVQAADGRQVQGRCTVPSAIPVESIVLDSGQANTFGGSTAYTEYYARLRWRDPAGQTNYYRVRGVSDNFNRGTITQPGKPTRDTLFRNTSNWNFDTSLPPVRTDAGRDGELLTSARATLVGTYYGISGQPPFRQPPRPVTGYLLHTDVNYHRYHDAVLRQLANDGNPFAEPAPIPTNIDGGLGCFGACNQTSLTVLLR